LENKDIHIEEQDRALVKGCLEDDRKAQEELYKKFAKQMYVVCKRYARDRDEAMDFLQEGFIEVFRKLHRYRFEGPLGGWIRRVIVYKTIDALRKENRYQEVAREFDAELKTEAQTFELENVKELKADRVRNLVNELPGKAGLVLKLFALEGLSHKEIAEYLDITIGTSKSQLNRARTLLKEALESE
tara:strand:- start:54962 stop:55522 length:561 start_codon:yes stop_codon:yes gene_type:complete